MDDARSGTGNLRSELGQDMIEYAIVLPMLLVMLLGLIEFGYLIFSYNTLTNAAREGARYGIIYDRTEAEIVAQARTLTFSLNSDDLQFTVTGAGCHDSSSDATVTVAGTYNARFITGNLLGVGPTVALHTEATMHCE